MAGAATADIFTWYMGAGALHLTAPAITLTPHSPESQNDSPTTWKQPTTLTTHPLSVARPQLAVPTTP